MTNIKTLACATLAVCALALPLVAQAQGRGQGGGQGRGGGMMMGGMQSGPGMLLARKDVHKDLKLSADKVKELEAIQKEFRDKLTAMFEGMRGGGQGGERPDFTAIQRDMETMSKNMDEKSLALLDDGQKKRVDQIQLQMRGNRALMEDKVQKELGFTTAQKRKMDDLDKAMTDANTAIRTRAMNGEIDRSEVQPLMEENNRILDAELAKILDDAQKKKFEEMKGPKFDRDPKVDEEMRNMMRGGRGGGN